MSRRGKRSTAPARGTQEWENQLMDFQQHLQKSSRILAVCGAGLSAASGLPTFRGAGGLWRTHVAQELATPEAFAADPGLVWQFYSYRRHMALSVKPNPAHYALAELARKMPEFVTLTQNVDGLSQRAEHPQDQLYMLHGGLFDVKCCDQSGCGHRETNFTDPIVPSLAIPTDGEDPTSSEVRKELDISNIRVNIPQLAPQDLPRCPHCKDALLRPGVVWFGESLPADVLMKVDRYFRDSRKVDLVLVIGTSSVVYPAAQYANRAREHGARICVINMDENDLPTSYRGGPGGDWIFRGDASKIVPELLRSIIGDNFMPDNRQA